MALDSVFWKGLFLNRKYILRENIYDILKAS